MADNGGLWIQAKTAVAFLTRLPVRFDSAPPALSAAAWAFPLIGVLVGGAGALALLATAWLGLAPTVCAIVALLVQVFLTGGLHEDGLADVADGFGGGADRARKLEIMRDSRIGAYGVMAVFFSLGLRAAVLAAYPGPILGALALLGAGAASRGLLPFVMRAVPPARSDGLGHGAGAPGAAGTGVSLVLGAAVAIAPMVLVFGPLTAVALWVAAMVAGLGVAWLAKRQIGGQTGDVLGAVQQASETLFLLALGVVS